MNIVFCVHEFVLTICTCGDVVVCSMRTGMYMKEYISTHTLEMYKLVSVSILRCIMLIK